VPKTILIADDNAKIRKLLCELFEVESEYQVCAQASNGAEAVFLAAKLRPDLIILDFSMPIMNGLDAALELKEALPNTPIILFTEHSNELLSTFASLPFDLILAKSDVSTLMDHARVLTPV
jgi:CheY-like chemotaxis protein